MPSRKFSNNGSTKQNEILGRNCRKALIVAFGNLRENRLFLKSSQKGRDVLLNLFMSLPSEIQLKQCCEGREPAPGSRRATNSDLEGIVCARADTDAYRCRCTR
jgi:hypothetical protein